MRYLKPDDRHTAVHASLLTSSNLQLPLSDTIALTAWSLCLTEGQAPVQPSFHSDQPGQILRLVLPVCQFKSHPGRCHGTLLLPALPTQGSFSPVLYFWWTQLGGGELLTEFQFLLLPLLPWSHCTHKRKKKNPGLTQIGQITSVNLKQTWWPRAKSSWWST